MTQGILKKNFCNRYRNTNAGRGYMFDLEINNAESNQPRIYKYTY